MNRKEEFLAQYGDSQCLENGLSDDRWRIRSAAIHNYGATKEHFDKVLKDSSQPVKIASLHAPNVTKEHLEKATKDSDFSVSYTANKELQKINDSK